MKRFSCRAKAGVKPFQARTRVFTSRIATDQVMRDDPPTGFVRHDRTDTTCRPYSASHSLCRASCLQPPALCSGVQCCSLLCIRCCCGRPSLQVWSSTTGWFLAYASPTKRSSRCRNVDILPREQICRAGIPKSGHLRRKGVKGHSIILLWRIHGALYRAFLLLLLQERRKLGIVYPRFKKMQVTGLLHRHPESASKPPPRAATLFRGAPKSLRRYNRRQKAGERGR